MLWSIYGLPRDRIEPMKKTATQIPQHKPLILNKLEAKGQFSSGIVKGLNYKVKLTIRSAYGFMSFNRLKSRYITLCATSQYRELLTDFSE
jgi:transposase